MNVEIRKADFGDWPALQRLNQDDLGYPTDEQIIKEQLKLNLASAENQIFVAENKGMVVGYIHLQIYNTLYFPKLTNILGLAVSGNVRGQQIGSSLLEAAEEWALAEGSSGIRLNSGSERKRAHHFYEKKGYQLKKTQANFTKYFGNDYHE